MVSIMMLTYWYWTVVTNKTYNQINIIDNKTCKLPANISHSYLKFDEISNTTTSITSQQTIQTNKLVHHAMFGLGHRFAKMSCAWHLTKSLNLTQMQLSWTTDCDNDESGEVVNIFSKLFGNDIIHVTNTNKQQELDLGASRLSMGKIISVSNDVDGYLLASNYIIHQIPITQHNIDSFNEKLSSDLELFKILRSRFVGKNDMIQFIEKHNFANHFVVGLHIRLGNGEGFNFDARGRAVGDEWKFIYNLIDLMRHFLERIQVTHSDRFVGDDGCTKTPLIFLATDTPKFIPHILNDTSLPVVIMDQIRVDKGVTYGRGKLHGQNCIKGWYDMILDNMTLGLSDILISARHSSFTQILPLSLLFDRGPNNRGPHYCEVSDTAETMTCLEDYNTWLYRDDPNKTFNYAINNAANSKEVVHGSMQVHLPDVDISDEYIKAKSFLSREGGKKEMKFGARFNQKYRWKPACPECTDFNIV